MASYWLYQCPSGRSEVSINETPFTDDRSPACTAGQGSWVEITIPEPIPIMDIVSIVLVVGMAICVALGFVAGQQR